MFVECAHGKGIKFVREELKYFAKTNVNVYDDFRNIAVLSHIDNSFDTDTKYNV